LAARAIYLDYHATTPADPRVIEAMLPFFGSKFGNAASRSHRFGWEAEQAVDRARQQVARLAGTAPHEVVFTGGATESNNLALKGLIETHRPTRNHIVTMATEHKAVLDTVKHLERSGTRTTVLPPRRDGLLDLDSLRRAIAPETVVVSVMYANNEIGVIQPVREIAAICREHGVLFHCDAAQAFGKIPIDIAACGIDLMSVSAHKMYGPKGVGALISARRWSKLNLSPQMDGGGHEFGMRSGTLNVPAIVGFGEACAICASEMEDEGTRLGRLRDRLKARLESGLDGVFVNGSIEHRLPGNLNVSFAGVDSEALLCSLPELALSTGSACSSASVEPSYVLKSLGVSEELAHSSLRFGLGRFNTEEEIDYAAQRVIEAVCRLRELSPVAALQIA
jgi:cysteine desulfurase